MHVELYETEDNQIHIVLQGEGHGELHFRDYNTFAEFIGKCYDLVESYETFAEAYVKLVMMETPIPEPFLDALDD